MTVAFFRAQPITTVCKHSLREELRHGLRQIGQALKPHRRLVLVFPQMQVNLQGFCPDGIIQYGLNPSNSIALLRPVRKPGVGRSPWSAGKSRSRLHALRGRRECVHDLDRSVRHAGGGGERLLLGRQFDVDDAHPSRLRPELRLHAGHQQGVERSGDAPES